jgi:hypothetical protein
MELVPLANKEALKRIKALNKQIAQQFEFELVDVSAKHDHLKRNQLTHWRNG